MRYLGNKVGNGLAIGKVLVIRNQIPEIKEWNLVDVNEKENEKKRVLDIVKAVISDYERVMNEAEEPEIKDLCGFYRTLLMSGSLQKAMIDKIELEDYNVFGAIKVVMSEKEKELSLIDNEYLRERSKDIADVTNKLLRKGLGIKELDLAHLTEDTILVSEEIAPSVLLSKHLEHVKGIVSELGGKTSHVAILARTLGIPSVFGIQDISNILQDGELIFLNGNQGYLETELTDRDIAEAKEKIVKAALLEQNLQEMIGKPAITKDGKQFEVAANAGDLTELDKLLEVKSDGIGLFRTEFLFLNRSTEPSEEYLFQVYKTFTEKLEGKPLIIRTLDIGGDKKCSYLHIPEEQNPFLGYRAIRYCLDHKDFFKVSLRAILRASHYGNVKIMYPMISSLEEIKEANQILEEAKQELRDQNIPFDANIQTGIMVEIPSVACMADLLIDEVDFFSIGTNDLIQYGLAVDRVNPTVSKLYNFFNPGVVRLIKHTIDAGKGRKAKFVGMCGEMAADPLGIILLVGLGLHEFSVNVASVLKVKKLISLIEAEKAEALIEPIMKMKTAEEIESCLNQYAKEAYGEYY